VSIESDIVLGWRLLLVLCVFVVYLLLLLLKAKVEVWLRRRLARKGMEDFFANKDLDE